MSKNTNPSILLLRIVSELICTVPDGHNSSTFCFTSTQTSLLTFNSCVKSEVQIKYDLHRHIVSCSTVQTNTSGCYKHVNKNLDFLKGLPTIKLIFSKRGLGKCKTLGEVKAIKSKK